MREPPVVHLHTLCWNEARLLPHFFRHYDPIVSAYHLWDNGSDDGSLALLQQHPRVSWSVFANDGDSFVDQARQLYDSIWKISRGVADWVIVCNIDEFLWHPNFIGHLADRAAVGDTLLPAVGLQMVAPAFPRRSLPLVETIRRGLRWPVEDKVCVFRPDLIDEIGYSVGRHDISPTGTVQVPNEPTLQLLHYKFLGPTYLLQRHRALANRLRPRDRAHGWGSHWLREDAALLRSYFAVLRTASSVVMERSEEPARAR